MSDSEQTSPAADEKTLVTFDFDGVTYTIPTADEWSLDAIEAFEDGKNASLMRAILGPVQWAKFKSVPRKGADLGNLFEAAEKAVDAGN